MLCPAASGAGDKVIGSADGDVAKHVWTLWWMRREALTGDWGLLTRLVNFPEGVHLWPIDPLDGVLGILVPLQPVALADALAFLHLTLLGLAAGWLGKLVSGSRLGGYVAGALAQGSAFAAFTLHVGVGGAAPILVAAARPRVPDPRARDRQVALVHRARPRGGWGYDLVLLPRRFSGDRGCHVAGVLAAANRARAARLRAGARPRVDPFARGGPRVRQFLWGFYRAASAGGPGHRGRDRR